jgi:DNA-binding CsgD family transcriptional regulator
MVMLVGEPGIGKTRTAEELKTYAGLRGAQVLWGRCYEAKGAPPYWPWIQAVRSYVRECGAKRLSSEMGSGGGVIAELIPDVREKLPDLPKPVALDNPESSRFRLFDAVTTFLKEASKGQPLVIVLDDLHWADAPTLVFLEFVAHELAGSRLMVLGTYRDVGLGRTHPLQKTLGDLMRERLFERVLLRGLGQQDVSRLMELASGSRPPAELAGAVYTHTEGNPLFVTEVVRLLVQQGDLEPEEVSRKKRWSLGIPEGVREVIGRRLDGLSARCNEALTVAAVVGRSFTSELLSRLIEDVSEDRLLEVLEEALAARVLEELPDAVGHYQFTHSLVQQSLLEELSITRRVRLHARIATAMEDLYSEEAETYAAELARHLAAAETLVGSEHLAHYSLVAGDAAFSRLGYEEALEHYGRGARAREAGPLDRENALLLFGLGRTRALLQRTESDLSAAFGNLSVAFDYFQRTGDIESAVRVGEVPFTRYVWSNETMTRIIERALALVPCNSHQEGRLLWQKAELVVRNQGDCVKGRDLFAKGLDIARRENDLVLQIRTLSSWAGMESFVGCEFERSLPLAEEAARLAEQVAEPFSKINACWVATDAHRQLGHGVLAKRFAEEMLRVSEKFHVQRGHARLVSSGISSLSGEWDEARDVARRLTVSERQDTHQAMALVQLAYLEYEADERQRADACFDRFLRHVADNRIELGRGEVTCFAVLTIPLISRITGDQSHLDLVAEAAQGVLSSSKGMVPVAWANREMGLASVLTGDTEKAAEYYLKLLDVPHISHDRIDSHRILGIMAHAIGKLDEALGHYQDCLAFCRPAGYRAEVAWTCCDCADSLLARHSAGDSEKAEGLLAEGLSLARDIGMRFLEKRIQERLRQIEDRPASGPSHPNGLTGREVEVLRLVAKGFTNREIADLLHISAKTVARHLQNIYEKAGCANRAEASAYAVQKGLIEK